MKLERPHIPFSVRVEVAGRQLRAQDEKLAASVLYGLADPTLSDAKRIRALLSHLFGDRPSHLDHDPALVNRRRYQRWANGKLRTFYDPPANDPEHLIYREGGKVGAGSEHDIKTRVHGDGAQRSDLGQRRYNKRVEENRGRRKRRPKVKIAARKSGWPKGRKIGGRR